MKKKSTKISEGESTYKHEIEYTKVEPCEDFYETFSDEEILDIIQNLESSRYINMKYSYFGVGAKYWDSCSNDNYVCAEKELLEYVFDLILQHIKKFDINKINLVDIGVGNAVPVKEILRKLHKKNILNKYIGLDSSNDMFKYAKKNLKNIIPENKIVMYQCDVERDSMYSILYKNKINSKQKICNILIELGGTIGNHGNILTVFENIHNSLDKDDLFFISNKILQKRNVLNNSHLLTPESKFRKAFILQHIGIDVSSCDFSYHYDEEKNLRYIIISLDKDYSINFKVLGKNRTVLLSRGTEIRIFNHTPFIYSQVIEWCEKTGISLSSINTTFDKEQALIGLSLDVDDE